MNHNTVFTEKDNEMLLKKPTKLEIKKVLQSSKLHTAPGSDGLSYYFYYKCFNIIGDTLTKVLLLILGSKKPPISQRTCKMFFANKPGKPNGKKLTDKRKISLLNSDFKI